MDHAAHRYSFYSFNRYMVECECLVHHICCIVIFRFNRYMVECESVKYS